MAFSDPAGDLGATLCTIVVFSREGVEVGHLDEDHCAELAELLLIQEEDGRWYPAPAVAAAAFPVSDFTRFVASVRRARHRMRRERVPR